jgi:hypothetical protein
LSQAEKKQSTFAEITHLDIEKPHHLGYNEKHIPQRRFAAVV